MDEPESKIIDGKVVEKAPTVTAVREQLGKILTADELDKSPRLIRLLRFIVTETLDEKSNNLNERVLAHEVFERDDSFDPTTNSIVRVEASRLRRRLKQYFLGPGRDDPISIELPVGTYVPKINWRIEESKRINAAISAEPPRDRNRVLLLPDKPTIAVLPFTNLSNNPEQEYFADGLASDLITALSRIRWLFVIARNSSFVFKGRAVDITQVGRELGVQYIVEGDLRLIGNRLRVNAQLIDATTGIHVWAEQYDRDLGDLFKLQDEIIEMVAGSIEPELGAFERGLALRKPPENLDAWDCYQRGLWHMWRFEGKENVTAKQMFLRAIGLDPGFGSAYSGLSYSHFLDASLVFTDSPINALEEAIGAAQKAIVIDDRDALAHCTLGRSYVLSGEVENGIAQLETAIELNPSFALAHFGLSHAIHFLGRVDEAIVAVDTAMRLSPHDPHLWLWETLRATALSVLGDNEEALVWAQKATQHPASGFFSFMSVALALGHLGRYEEAHPVVDKLLDMKPDFSILWLKEYFHYAEPTVLDHYIRGLIRAGLDPPVMRLESD